MAMQPTDRRELIREGLLTLGSGALLMGSLCVSGGLFGAIPLTGTVAVGAVQAVAGNWLATPTYNRFGQLCARFARTPATQPALWRALGNAYTAALHEIARDLDAQARRDQWNDSHRRAIAEAVRLFRADVEWLWSQSTSAAGTGTPATTSIATLEDLIGQIAQPDQSPLQRAWRERFAAYLSALEGVCWPFSPSAPRSWHSRI